MRNLLKKALYSIIRIKTSYRRAIFVSIDVFLWQISSLISIFILSDISNRELEPFWIVKIIPLISFPIYLITGQYKSITRYVQSFYFYRNIIRNLLIVILIKLIGYLFADLSKPSDLYLLLLLILSSFLTGGIRFILRDIIIYLRKFALPLGSNIAIYGAGEAGAQLIMSLKREGIHNKFYFFDDSPELWQRNLGGIKILPPSDLIRFKNKIDKVILAIPSLGVKRRKNILSNLEKQGFKVLQIPSLAQLASGKEKIESLKTIRIEDLLSRNSVASDNTALIPTIHGKNIFVSGAGGSIGSEICRQIIKLKPKKLIILDISEPSLYKIDKELINSDCLESYLGDSTDEKLIKDLFIKHKVEIVFHAAAYKHVPIVEANPIQGIYNNVLSTKVICQVSDEIGVEKVILLSSDKAVRPTNVMGASKRLAELIMQAYSQSRRSTINKLTLPSTCFAMVRFGNVLGSSGSVVPLFRQQISEGGPLSITHPEIIRYFMTVEEAVQLVLHASSLAKGGEVFLLDMGEPVKIFDLAKQMIRLSGNSVKDKSNPEGDIEILITGLRPGEKLYEELLIDAKSEPTKHNLIFKAMEKSISYDLLLLKLNELEKNLQNRNLEQTLKILKELVPEWVQEKYK